MEQKLDNTVIIVRSAGSAEIMKTLETKTNRKSSHYYSGGGDLSGVDLQVFSGSAFVKHVAALVRMARGKRAVRPTSI
jgi:hypothetical protein